MTTFFKLVRVFLIQTYRLNKDQKKSRKYMYIGMLLGFLPLIAIGALSAFVMGAALKGDTARGAGFLSLIFIADFLIIMFFGLIAMLQAVFFSKDAETLLSLPVRPATLFFAKMVVVYISELTIAAATVIPFAVAFGIGFGVSAVYYIAVPFAALLMPFIPLLIITLLSFPLMYVLSFFKNKSMLSLICVLVLFGGFFTLYFIGINALSSGAGGFITENPGGEAAFALPEAFLNFLNSARQIPPFGFFASFMLLENALVNLLLFVACTVGLAALALLIASSLYTRGIRGQLEGNASKERGNDKKTKLETKSAGFERSYLMKEIKTLSRETGFAFQSFMGAVMGPLFLFLINGGVFGNAMEMEGGKIASSLFMTTLSSFMVIALCGGSNYTAYAAFTREGKYFYMNKYLPISYSAIVKLKTRFANYVTAVGVSLSAVVLFINALIGGHGLVGIIGIPLICGIAALIGFSTNKFGILRDLKRPKLVWNNANEALKHNTYAMVPMLISMAAGLFIMIEGMILFGLMTAGLLNEILGYAVFWILAYLAAILVYVIFGRGLVNAEELFERIEC